MWDTFGGREGLGTEKLSHGTETELLCLGTPFYSPIISNDPWTFAVMTRVMSYRHFIVITNIEMGTLRYWLGMLKRRVAKGFSQKVP